jgi:polyferredoxin
MKALRIWVSLGILALPGVSAYAQSTDKFPRPEFQNPYSEPKVQHSKPRALFMEWVDVVVLLGTLSISSYFGLKKVSRKGIFWLSVFAVTYFGFYREGCVCPVGSTQNVARGLGAATISAVLGEPQYVVPLSVIIIFLLPLLFALFLGRSFCAAVCPLGAAQEMVIIKPIKIHPTVKQFLSIIPYVYLGTAVLLAYLGGEYIICKFDPFVGFFRMGANFGMFLFSAAVLVIGTVVARPYCRFMCPYSILLKWTSVFSKWHLKTTPTECIQCRLCEESCPFDHLHKPSEDKEPEARETAVRRLGFLLALTPVLMAAGMGLGWLVHVPLARAHWHYRLAERVALEKAKLVTDTTEESRAFYETSTPVDELLRMGENLRLKFRSGSMILGAFIGLVVGCKLIALAIRRKRTDYEPNRGDCYSCARCSDACSVGRVPAVPVGTMRVVLRFQQPPQVAQSEHAGKS